MNTRIKEHLWCFYKTDRTTYKLLYQMLASERLPDVVTSSSKRENFISQVSARSRSWSNFYFHPSIASRVLSLRYFHGINFFRILFLPTPHYQLPSNVLNFSTPSLSLIMLSTLRSIETWIGFGDPDDANDFMLWTFDTRTIKFIERSPLLSDSTIQNLRRPEFCLIIYRSCSGIREML